MTTEDIDQLVYRKTKELGGEPATLGYEGYPKSVCISINEEVCHGIPTKDRILREGDIVNVDVSTVYEGYYGDSSRMFCLGTVSAEKQKLVRITKESVENALKEVRPWGFLGDIAQAVSNYVKHHNYSVVEEIGGHGIGLEFHEEPWVGYTGKKGTGMLLVPGMIFTIEPMINMGTREIYTDSENGWTIYTADHQASAQWEVMVLVTETGYEILAF